MESDLSFKVFTNNTQLRDVSPVVGVTIRGTSFAQDKPDTPVFADGSSDITFEDCNMDNVLLPPNSTLIRGCRRRWIAIDGIDTLLDENNNPIGPL